MRSLRRTIEIQDGVKVDTLFTPHLYSFQSETGLSLQVETEDLSAVMDAYADLYYLAALNAWVLDGHGAVSDFPHTRGDFHAYMAASPKSFAKDIDFAVLALTGKSLKEVTAAAPETQEEKEAKETKGKKKLFGWIGRLLKRSS